MKKLTLWLTGLTLACGATVALAQPAAPTDASPVSSYSAPTEKHVKKPKKAKTPRKGASAPTAAPAEGASQ
ncbi:MAG: acid-shock protein [Paraburkholderia sp.]|nr:acid-shock protein [Paraburkholderia sp.]